MQAVRDAKAGKGQNPRCLKLIAFLKKIDILPCRHADHALPLAPTPTNPPRAHLQPHMNHAFPHSRGGPERKLFLSPARAQRCDPNFIPLLFRHGLQIHAPAHTRPEYPPLDLLLVSSISPATGHGPPEPPAGLLASRELASLLPR